MRLGALLGDTAKAREVVAGLVETLDALRDDTDEAGQDNIEQAPWLSDRPALSFWMA